MRLLFHAVASARHDRRYRRLRRAQWREDGGGRVTRGVIRFFVWGLPALPLVVSVAAVAERRADVQIATAFAIAAVLGMVHLRAEPDASAFDLLHRPSRAGLVLGRVLDLLPWLSWAGGCLAAAVVVAVPDLATTRGGVAALLALAAVPLMTAVRAVDTEAAARAGTPSSGGGTRYLALGVFGIVMLAKGATGSMGLFSTVFVPLGVLTCLLRGAYGVWSGGVWRAARRVAVDAVRLAACVAPAALPGGTVHAWWSGPLLGALVTLVTITHLRSLPRHAGTMEMEDTRPDGTEAAEPAPASPASPPRPERGLAGRGLWTARWMYLRARWLAPWKVSVPAGMRLRRYLESRIVFWPFTLRAGILVAAAVAASREGAVAVPLAVAGALLASRVGSVDTLDLHERLWTLGVDYRTQVLHGLRSLFRVGAVSGLVGGVAALVLKGPADPARQIALAVFVAALLVRAGLPGFWPFRETHRLFFGLVWIAAIVFSFAPGLRWPIGDALSLTVWAGAVGLAGLVVRLVRLREPRLRDAVRRAAEP